MRKAEAPRRASASASEQLKATGVTFRLSELSSCLEWAVSAQHGESVGLPQNLAVKVAFQAAWGLPGPSSVWIMTSLATQGGWELGLLFLFLFFLFLFLSFFFS